MLIEHLGCRVFEILNDINLVFQNWVDSRVFANIFYKRNFAEEHI